MPAYAFEVAEAEAEGVEIVFLANPTRVLGTERVAGVQVVRMALGEPDADGQAAGPLGRRRPVPVAGSEFVLEADTVIAAIGQTPDAAFLPPTCA
jgi:formate dehydrogenase beta subunit